MEFGVGVGVGAISFETNINSLKDIRGDVENELSSEIKLNSIMLIGSSRLQDSADNGFKKSAKNETLAQATTLAESWLPDNGKANNDDEKLMGVLDEVHVLNQRLLKVRKDACGGIMYEGDKREMRAC